MYFFTGLTMLIVAAAIMASNYLLSIAHTGDIHE